MIKVKTRNYFFLLIGLTFSLHHVILKDQNFSLKNQLNPFSNLVNRSNIKILKELGNKNLQLKGLNQEEITKKISLEQLQQKRYFLSLATYAEGFIPHIYHDNQGYALGMGWNLTQQNQTFNYELANTVYANKYTIQEIAHLNNQHQELTKNQEKNVYITPNQALQISYLLKEHIENHIVIPKLALYLENHEKIHKEYAEKKAKYIFERLQKNEQDALIYHVYKVGGDGFLKYQHLLKNIVIYSEHKTFLNKEKVMEQFTYYYIKNHKLYEDKKATLLVASMFDSPSVFEKVILHKRNNFLNKILAYNDKKLHHSKNKNDNRRIL